MRSVRQVRGEERTNKHTMVAEQKEKERRVLAAAASAAAVTVVAVRLLTRYRHLPFFCKPHGLAGSFTRCKALITVLINCNCSQELRTSAVLIN